LLVAPQPNPHAGRPPLVASLYPCHALVTRDPCDAEYYTSAKEFGRPDFGQHIYSASKRELLSGSKTLPSPLNAPVFARPMVFRYIEISTTFITSIAYE